MNLDPDLTSGILAIATLLLLAIAAIVAGRRSAAENIVGCFRDPHKWN